MTDVLDQMIRILTDAAKNMEKLRTASNDLPKMYMANFRRNKLLENNLKKIVAEVADIPVGKLITGGRTRKYLEPRSLVVYFLVQRYRYTLEAAIQAVGRTNHATAINCVKIISDLLVTNDARITYLYNETMLKLEQSETSIILRESESIPGAGS